MNCKEILRVLLAAEHPDRPSADVRKHLSRCPSCRTWHRRLVRLERHIPQIPVPATDARERLLARLREAPVETIPLVQTTAPVAAVRGPELSATSGAVGMDQKTRGQRTEVRATVA